MGRRRKSPDRGEPQQPPARSAEARTSLRGLLKDVVVEDAKGQEAKGQEAKGGRPAPKPRVKRKPPKAPVEPPAGRPSETLRGDDRIAWYDAFAGVRPLDGKARRTAPAAREVPAPEPVRSEGDEEARARLAALVAGGVRFEMMRDGDEVRGWRAGTAESVVRGLMRKAAFPEATIDLHGMRASEAEQEVVRFVRTQQRRGVRRVCIVHGKGLHSTNGPVLRDRVVHALTEGGAAPVVRAFVTASHERGGSGALLVELMR